MTGRSKYGNIKTKLDGHAFASKAEARRFAELKLLERAGLISSLTLQPKFPIVVNGTKVTTYIADFQYTEKGRVVIEDVKSTSTITPVYRLKKKLLKASLGLTVIEVFR